MLIADFQNNIFQNLKLGDYINKDLKNIDR